MPEEIKTAQTTVQTDADNHADVDTTKENVNDVEFTDTPGEPQGGTTATKETGTTQTKEQNSEKQIRST